MSELAPHQRLVGRILGGAILAFCTIKGIENPALRNDPGFNILSLTGGVIILETLPFMSGSNEEDDTPSSGLE